MSSLTDRQKRAFERNGFVVLRDAVDPELIDATREAVENDETMTEGNQNEPAAATETIREMNRELFEYADELVGGEQLHQPDDEDFGTFSDEQARIGLRYADEKHLSDPAAQESTGFGIHVDNPTDGDGGLYALGAATYLDRVGPRSGGFTVWPGSHWITAEYLEPTGENEDALPGTRSRASDVRLRDDAPFEDMTELFELFSPFEVAGGPGTVTLWHANLIHSGGRHLAPSPVRMAAFSRFHVEPGRVALDEAMANPLDHWEGVGNGDVDTAALDEAFETFERGLRGAD